MGFNTQIDSYVRITHHGYFDPRLQNMQYHSLTPIIIFILSFQGTLAAAIDEHTSQPEDSVEKYGWTSVPHDQSVLLRDVSPWNPADYTIADIHVPNSEIVTKVTEYAKEQLPEQVFNHSMRVYYYGKQFSCSFALSFRFVR